MEFLRSRLRQRRLPLSQLDLAEPHASQNNERITTSVRVLRFARNLIRRIRWLSWRNLVIAFFATFLLLYAIHLFVWDSSWGCDRLPLVSAANCWWAEPKSVQSHFIYVYELPRRFNVDLSDRLTSHHLSDFHLDNLLFRALQRSNIHRTVDPEAASLFFLPVLPMLHLALRLPSLEAPSLALADETAEGETAARGNGLELSLEHWEALADTGRYVGEALLYVQSHYPYWRRSGGSDHFIIASHPYGRCGILPFVNPSLLGSLFTLQPSSYPDLLFRSVLHLTPAAAAAAAARRRAAAGSKQTTAAGRLKAALAGKKRQQEQQEGVGVGDVRGRVGIRQQKLQLQQMSKKERRRGGGEVAETGGGGGGREKKGWDGESVGLGTGEAEGRFGRLSGKKQLIALEIDEDMHCASPGNDVIMPPLLPLTPPIPPDARNRSLPVLVLLGPPHRSPPLPAPPHHSPSLSAPLASPPPAKDIPNENPTSLAHAKHTPTDPIGNEGLTRRLLGEGVTRQSGDDGNNGGGGDWDRHGLWKEGEATSESTKKSTQRSDDDGKGGSGYWDRHGLWKEGEGDDVASADGVAGAAVAAGGAGETGETRAAGEAATAGESGRAEGWKEDVRRRDEGNGSNEGMGAAGGGFDREAVRGAFMEMVGTSNPKGWALLQLTPHAAAAAMQGAVFCVCLPDASHWHEMVCMAQAVVNGCIPVTFFHHYRHPWLHSLPFSAFSLNIDPMDVHETAMRLDVMLLDMSLLWRMQTELLSVQQRLLYNESAPISAVDQVFTALQNKASLMLYGQPLENNE